MNPQKIEKIFSLMKQFGVEHFKHEDLEIKMAGQGTETARIELPSFTKSAPIAPEPQAIPPVESKIPHHVNEVADLLKLSDEDLVDKLFPDYSQLPKDGE